MGSLYIKMRSRKMYRQPTNVLEFYDIFLFIIFEHVINKITS